PHHLLHFFNDSLISFRLESISPSILFIFATFDAIRKNTIKAIIKIIKGSNPKSNSVGPKNPAMVIILKDNY
ncbi:MAG: hypothetical protein KAU83_01015, partial [Bacteroidales bacterium]|nr:hypothetical protein [Bacteroidales bacterium]